MHKKESGNLPEVNLEFAGPFRMQKIKKYLLVSVDNNSGWPEALLLPNQTAEEIEFLIEYIAVDGVFTVNKNRTWYIV